MAKHGLKIDTLVRSEVARWRAWQAPYGATAEEVAACGARRTDYADRVVQSLRAVTADEAVLLRVVGKVLAQERDASATSVPDVETILGRVRTIAQPRAGVREVPCAICEAEGGQRLHPGGELLEVATAVVGPWVQGGPSVPACLIHHAENCYTQAAEAHATSRGLRMGGDVVHFQHAPAKPYSLEEAPRGPAA